MIITNSIYLPERQIIEPSQLSHFTIIHSKSNISTQYYLAMLLMTAYCCKCTHSISLQCNMFIHSLYRFTCLHTAYKNRYDLDKLTSLTCCSTAYRINLLSKIINPGKGSKYMNTFSTVMLVLLHFSY